MRLACGSEQDSGLAGAKVELRGDKIGAEK